MVGKGLVFWGSLSVSAHFSPFFSCHHITFAPTRFESNHQPSCDSSIITNRIWANINSFFAPDTDILQQHSCDHRAICSDYNNLSKPESLPGCKWKCDTCRTWYWGYYSNTYVLTASTDEIDFEDIIESFATDILPQELRPILTNLPLNQIVIREMTMKLPLILQTGVQRIHISGIPSLNGFSLGEISAVIVKEASEIVHVIEAIDLPSINLANFLKKLHSSTKTSTSTWFSRQKIFLTLSSLVKSLEIWTF